LKNDEPVLTATRDGINWTHPFAKALKLAVEGRIEPLIQEEREHAIHDEQTKLDKKLRKKLDRALHELNTSRQRNCASGIVKERRSNCPNRAWVFPRTDVRADGTDRHARPARCRQR
jgi:hypothetical protein